MSETRKLVAILATQGSEPRQSAIFVRSAESAVANHVGGDLIDPTIAVHHGRVVKRTGGGGFRSSCNAGSHYLIP